MATSESSEALLRLLLDLSPLKEAFFMGSIAEDALLNHEILPGRSDIDLLVEERRLNALLVELAEVGVQNFKPFLDCPQGLLAPLRSDDRAIPVEIWPTTATSEGYGLGLPADPLSGLRYTFFTLLLPMDTFDQPRSRFGGASIQTVSPLALATLRAASAKTRGNLEKRLQDVQMLERLQTALLSRLHPQEVTPVVTPLA